jgi:hypothetical protein
MKKKKTGICPLPRFHSYSSWNKRKFVLVMILDGMFGFDKQWLEKNKCLVYIMILFWTKHFVTIIILIELKQNSFDNYIRCNKTNHSVSIALYKGIFSLLLLLICK